MKKVARPLLSTNYQRILSRHLVGHQAGVSLTRTETKQKVTRGENNQPLEY